MMSLRCLMNGLEVNYPCSPVCALFGDCVSAFEAQKKTRVVTNADRIRAMTDEELMKFIEDTGIAGCPYPAMSCRASCQVCILDWLKQPAEVSHD